MRRRPAAPPGVSAERWVVSYADFITLLFAFFVVMYSISSVDAAKLQQVSEGVKAAFLEGLREAPPIPLDTFLDEGGPGRAQQDRFGAIRGTGAANPELGLLRDRLEASLGRLDDAENREAARAELTPRGLVVSLAASRFFEPGSAELNARALPVLDAIGRIVSGVRGPLRVEGHTDDRPIGSERFASNWELSTARATAVLRVLVERFGVAPERLAAVGYAAYRPVAPNDTSEGRALNRRVDVVLLSPVEAADEPGYDAESLEMREVLRRMPPPPAAP